MFKNLQNSGRPLEQSSLVRGPRDPAVFGDQKSVRPPSVCQPLVDVLRREHGRDALGLKGCCVVQEALSGTSARWRAGLSFPQACGASFFS